VAGYDQQINEGDKMKINEVALKQNEGGIWICRVKPDGTVKDTEKVNVTEQVIEMFCELCKSEEGKAMLYNRNGKAFEIHVRELSQEEVSDINAEKVRKGRRALADLNSFMYTLSSNHPDMARVLRVAKQKGLIR